MDLHIQLYMLREHNRGNLYINTYIKLLIQKRKEWVVILTMQYPQSELAFVYIKYSFERGESINTILHVRGAFWVVY